MTKKDYELIAKTLRRTLGQMVGTDRGALIYVARELAIDLVANNPKFDPARFLRTIGAN